ncbi:Uncharacterised protein [Bordetella pertussis]|nr:Uncharacterised protein [Bordetella pertussis]
MSVVGNQNVYLAEAGNGRRLDCCVVVERNHTARPLIVTRYARTAASRHILAQIGNDRPVVGRGDADQVVIAHRRRD